MLLENLETQRIIFKPLTDEYQPYVNRFLSNPEVVEYLFPVTDPEESARFMIDKQEKRYAEDSHGLYALIEKETGAFLGMCGPLIQVVDGVREMEIGYHLMPEHWGQGFASEAVQACRKYIFENNMSESIISIIHVDNIRSQRVAERNGMVRDKETEYTGLPVYIYRIKKEE